MPAKPNKGKGVHAEDKKDRAQNPNAPSRSGAASALSQSTRGGKSQTSKSAAASRVSRGTPDGSRASKSVAGSVLLGTARKKARSSDLASGKSVSSSDQIHSNVRQKTPIRRADPGESRHSQATPKTFREGIEQSLEYRVISSIRTSLRQMTSEQLQRAVAAPTPAATVVEVLNAAPEAGLQRETATTRALARGAVAKQTMIGAAGGFLSSSEVARLLGISVSAVNIRRTRNSILALPLSGAEWGFPARQFSAGGLRKGVAEVVRAAGSMSRWVLLSILIDTAPASDSTLLESLERPEVLGDVLSRISSYGQHGAS
ncbi:hypothetical protein [Longimicrobium terrae]|uniref:DNA-binding protein n=1 Tax=Longimicrobium terrae TaxID=1639882 RepID=A0A841H1Y4_9BACT|nr:hypothetical protein [Longimicrobium terrae]MBB4637549.1 hypothetical protein [Longimicrobium terrae]MBB6071946.1 hypothetical protein [Longimicrobium terrae]NNC30492.1 hypothetical protein [Longimicrobium terrae]